MIFIHQHPPVIERQRGITFQDLWPAMLSRSGLGLPEKGLRQRDVNAGHRKLEVFGPAPQSQLHQAQSNGKPRRFYFKIIIWAYSNFPKSHWNDENNKNKRRKELWNTTVIKEEQYQPGRSLENFWKNEPSVIGYLTKAGPACESVQMLAPTALCQPGLEAKILWDPWGKAYGDLWRLLPALRRAINPVRYRLSYL